MSASTTVVFADLTGSTTVFESLGNAKATRAITKLTQWIGSVCDAHGGRVVKTLGDGVLALFPDGGGAIDAVVALHREHAQRLEGWPEALRMRLQVGVAAGELIEVDGDCYGDAVNVASRLSDLSGADQIWATESVVSQIRTPGAGVRFRSLGPIAIRGKAEGVVVFRVEWHQDTHTVNLTQPSPLARLPSSAAVGGSTIELSWLDQKARFAIPDLPAYLGRDEDAEFTVNDQRVSRQHARILWRNGGFVLTDLSSYGTWVRFDQGGTELALRRNDCILLGSGHIALGAAFEDFTVPTVEFKVTVAKA
jgi:class 3 adenylate cyclase